MAEPTTFPEEHTSAPLIYRRISGFAIAGLAFALFFALYVLVIGGLGLYERTPMLLPPVIEMLAVIGAVLSLIAFWVIRRSEGTLAGMRLAQWGWWVSVVFGLGYAAYYATTYFAVRQQAERFTLRWLNRIGQGKLNDAFVDTLDPATRLNINPEEEEALRRRFNQPGSLSARGLLDSFRTSELVHILHQAGGQAQIEPLGVAAWDYKSGSYKVARAYRIQTEEGLLEALITAYGSESRKREFEGRQWHIVWGESARVQRYEPSMIGQNIAYLRRMAGLFLTDWLRVLSEANLDAAYLETRPTEQRERLRLEFAGRGLLANLSAAVASQVMPPSAPLLLASALDVELARELYLPEYYSLFRRTSILVTDKVQADDPKTRNVVRKSMRALLGAPEEGLRAADPRAEGSSTSNWKVEAGRLQLPQDAKIAFRMAETPGFSAEVTVTVECDPGPLDHPLEPMRNLNWRVLSINLRRAEDNSSRVGVSGRPGLPGLQAQ
jgi:hypothetical protein